MRRAILNLVQKGAILGVLLAGCASPPAPGRPPRVDSLPLHLSDPSATTSELIEAHNRTREAAGLAGLEPDSHLEAAATRHARDMARRHRMSHRGGDGSSPFRRIQSQGYQFRRAGENVACGQITVESVMDDWMRSPGHRRNILGEYTQIGAACATDENGTPYWCVTFGFPTRP
jgi:uncharacterized protein YkwD